MAKYVTVLCVIGGLLLGVLAAFINSRISRKNAGKDNMVAIMGTNLARMGMDILALGAAFFVCRRFELPMIATMVSVAVGLTAAGMLFLKRITDQMLSQDAKEKDGGE